MMVLLSRPTLAGELTVSGNPAKGKEIFNSRGCPVCHSIDRTGGEVGPDLTQVTVRRTDRRLVDWLKDPASILKDTDMPKVPWASEEEIFDLIAFFKTVRKEIKKDFLGKVPAEEAGRLLVAEYDCASCHVIKDPSTGRARFPDLTNVGNRRTKDWLDMWLKDPQAAKPGTFMPTYPFSDEERTSIVEYLSTLK